MGHNKQPSLHNFCVASLTRAGKWLAFDGLQRGMHDEKACLAERLEARSSHVRQTSNIVMRIERMAIAVFAE